MSIMYVLTTTLNTLNDINTIYLILRNNGFNVSKEELKEDIDEEIRRNDYMFYYVDKLRNVVEIRITPNFRLVYLSVK